MSLFKVFDVAGSAMHAQNVRLNATSSNLANADSVSSNTDETYRAKQPLFAPMLNEFASEMEAVGVKVTGVVESQAPLRTEYSPGHPMANEE
ncbi:MAG: flagellar basal body protein, partial [Thioalkalispiraceae bacterium]